MRPSAVALALLLAAPAAFAADRSLACTEFYAYVNVVWLKQAPIAPDRAYAGTFVDLREENTQRLIWVLSQVKPGDPQLDTPGTQLAVAYYISGMDTAAIEGAGLTPLAPLLSAVDALEQPEQLPALLARLNRAGIAAPFSVWIGPDARDKRRYRLALSQSGLGLPDRDGYARTDDRTQHNSCVPPSTPTRPHCWRCSARARTPRRRLPSSAPLKRSSPLSR